ncbi:replication-relaxation family protein [Kitasatospora sp. NPDC101447]|uniref:replication-relaxation family protein n=1 Tax=Kitasatospora sp. NPDC101447 TaxID=3364102 RepID=UPI0037F9B5DD
MKETLMTVTVPTKRRKRRHDGAEFDRAALAALYQHRLATSGQLYELLGPFTTGEGENEQESHNFPAARLRKLRDDGLVDHATRYFPGRTRIWFLTEAGRALAGSFPELLDRVSPSQSVTDAGAQLLAPHTLDVLRTHLAFLRDARRRGDEYQPLDWAPEVYHRLSDRAADAIRADALMRYTVHSPKGRAHLRAFVELDRSTMSSEKLSSKLTAYARYFEYTPVPVHVRGTTEAQGALPAWQDFYPRFPRILFVLTAGSEKTSETTLRNRIEDLQVSAADNARVASFLRHVPAGAATLQDIEAYGATAKVWSSLADPDRSACGWTEL